VLVVACVAVSADDLTHVIDAGGDGAVGAQRMVERDVGPAVVEESVVVASGVGILADDLALIVDAARLRAAGAREGIIERQVKEALNEEAVAKI
jgi:hypothetical protein